uniref:Uncharacterized protein n=1 Tax=Rhizophora mucronata TaxID=61149 RepID=A0A2P2NXM1_RHIMU
MMHRNFKLPKHLMWQTEGCNYSKCRCLLKHGMLIFKILHHITNPHG